MASGQKKVVIRCFSRGVLRGYTPGNGFIRRSGAEADLEFLDLHGRVQALPLGDVKMLHFVREFHLGDDLNPERLPRKQFLARPRSEGLWIRLSFRDGDELEGLAPLDLSLADGFAEDLGLQLAPPDVRGNSQRVYAPRSALSGMQIVAVVTTPTRRKQLEHLPLPAARAERVAQPNLFASSPGDTAR